MKPGKGKENREKFEVLYRVKSSRRGKKITLIRTKPNSSPIILLGTAVSNDMIPSAELNKMVV